MRWLRMHLDLAIEHKGERKGVIEFRKHYSGYLRGIHGAAKLRHELMQFTEREPLLERLSAFLESYPQSEYA